MKCSGQQWNYCDIWRHSSETDEQHSKKLHAKKKKKKQRPSLLLYKQMVFMQATQLESEIQNATYCCETLILVTFAKHCQKRHPLALSANSPSH